MMVASTILPSFSRPLPPPKKVVAQNSERTPDAQGHAQNQAVFRGSLDEILGELDENRGDR